MSKWIAQTKRRMKEKGLTQEDIAKAMGKTTRGAVSHYFSGRSEPSIKQIYKLADFLKVSVSWLVDGHEKIDEKVLDYCLDMVEAAEEASGKTLTNKQRANFLKYLYELVNDGQKVDQNNANEILKLLTL
tara:strand:- start:19 stop:408 length:390 start_codon:yes stop_codon:yes gene_type:complete